MVIGFKTWGGTKEALRYFFIFIYSKDVPQYLEGQMIPVGMFGVK